MNNGKRPDWLKTVNHETYLWGSTPEPDKPFPLRFHCGDLQIIIETCTQIPTKGTIIVTEIEC